MASLSHAEANRIVREQFEDVVGRPATDLEAIYIQAVAWCESNYGRADGQHSRWIDQGLYNWANIEKGTNADGGCDPGWVPGKDGGPRCFRVFQSDDEAAEALISNLTKRHWPVLQSIAREGTAQGVAHAMAAAPSYYYPATQTDENRYANCLRGAVNEIKKHLSPSDQPVIPPSKARESSGWWWKLPSLAYGTYRLAKWARKS